MSKSKVIVLGSTGMLGHMMSLFLTEKKLDVLGLSRRELKISGVSNESIDFDILADSIELIESYKPDIIINCIGILNDEASFDRLQAIKINSLLPQMISEKYRDSKTKLIQISTDCVFSGLNPPYTEKSTPDGKGDYAWTKILGEVNNEKDLTIRTSIIGPDINENGIGLFNWFMRNKHKTLYGYEDIKWTGVTNLELAKLVFTLMESNISGLVHLVNNSEISKFELIKLFNQYFNNGQTVINKDNKKRLSKVLNSGLDLNSLKIPSYEEMISELKTWVEEHKSLYKNYFS